MSTGDATYNLEQAVLRWWRDVLDLPSAYPTESMPQEGATETVLADQVSSAEVMEFVLRRLEEQGISDPAIRVPPKTTLV